MHNPNTPNKLLPTSLLGFMLSCQNNNCVKLFALTYHTSHESQVQSQIPTGMVMYLCCILHSFLFFFFFDIISTFRGLDFKLDGYVPHRLHYFNFPYTSKNSILQNITFTIPFFFFAKRPNFALICCILGQICCFLGQFFQKTPLFHVGCIGLWQ